MAKSNVPTTYIVAWRLYHDNVSYEEGDTITLTDQKVIDQLRASGVILLPNEVKSAEEVAVQLEEAKAEVDRLTALVAEMQAANEAARAEAAASASSGKSGKAAKSAPAEESPAE